MNKYDFGYELQPDSTIEWAYNKVEEHSIVLELGPSNGNLVKHLLSEKSCIIDIIEIDEEAGKQAAVFARNSCIGDEEGDLEKYIWAERLKNNKYDYIIILDVLEHLKNPDEVLKRLGDVLNADGKILISIPNIAHNSVVLELMNNHFKYTDVGLLDCTHLKFFTYESVVDLIYSNGYYIDSEEAKQIRVGNNEICSIYEDVPRRVQSYLKTRHMGETYQFLMVLKKGLQDKKYGLNADLYEQKQYNFNVFTDDGELIYSARINPLKDIEIVVPIDSQDVIKTLRIDPLDKNCILDRVVIIADCDGESKEYMISQNTGINLGSKIIFFDDDPQLYIDINNTCSEVKFSCKVLDFDSENLMQVGELRDYVRKLIKEDLDVYEIMLADKRIIEDLQLQNHDLTNWLESSRQETKDLGDEIQKLNGILDAKAKEIVDLTDFIKESESHISDLKGVLEDREKQLVDSKETIEESNRQLAGLAEVISDKECQIANLSGSIEEKERELNVIKRHFLYRFWIKVLKLKHCLAKCVKRD